MFDGVHFPEDSGQSIIPKLMSLIDMSAGKPKVAHLMPILYFCQRILCCLTIFQLFINGIIFVDDVFEEVFALAHVLCILAELLHHLLIVLTKLQSILSLLLLGQRLLTAIPSYLVFHPVAFRH